MCVDFNSWLRLVAVGLINVFLTINTAGRDKQEDIIILFILIIIIIKMSLSDSESDVAPEEDEEGKMYQCKLIKLTVN